MKKLKDILLEAYAWERKPGQPLPTLAEVQAEYLRNEASKKDGDTKETMKSAAKDMNEEDAPRWQDSDGDGKWYEPEDVNEYGDDETHMMDASRPKNSESDVREKDINEAFWRRVKGNLYGHEYILREAFQSFKKNLAENVFQGEPVEPEVDTFTAYQIEMVNLKVNGQMRQLLWLPAKIYLQQALDLAQEEDAYLPTREELDSLQKSIRPGETVGDIWIDQGNEVSANMRYVLFNLSDGADVVSNAATPRDTVSDAVVLLRKTPMMGAVTVFPKP